MILSNSKLVLLETCLGVYNLRATKAFNTRLTDLRQTRGNHGSSSSPNPSAYPSHRLEVYNPGSSIRFAQSCRFLTSRKNGRKFGERHA